MAASARICGGGGGSACAVRCDRRPVTARSPCVVPVTNGRNFCEIGKISMTMDDLVPPSAAVKIDRMKIGERKRGGSVVSRERLDVWLRDSVVEIVKNLRESPLLVHLYAEANGGLTTTATNPEAEDWPVMEGRWERGEERTPEGVILVEKLADGDVADREGDDDYDEINDGGACGEGTSAWGIVAQGRGMYSGPVCYLLKTTRVGSGMGTVCTHFCLVKVKSFRETAMSQLNNSWLVQTGQ